MARPSLNDEDYQLQAELKDLTLMGHAPLSVYDKAMWECIRCGKVMEKTYRAVRYGEVGCRCQSNRLRLPKESYEQLAQDLNIEWLSGEAPLNVRQDTMWRGRTGYRVIISYRLIAYGLLSSDSRELLGLPEGYYDELKNAQSARLAESA